MDELQPMQIKKFGWIRSLPNMNNPPYIPPLRLTALPNTVDLRHRCPAIYDQGELGSCTANAIAALYQFLEIKQGRNSWIPSRLFIYYNERSLAGTVDVDSGATITDGMKVVSELGVPNESLWWYNINKFAIKPNKAVYQTALNNKIREFKAIDNTNLQIMQTCLTSGYPIVIGFTVYESFESAEVRQTGIVKMPLMQDKLLGGHAVLIVGYNNNQNCFIVRNSWGSKWGINGYFYIPYAYLTNTNLAADAWTASLVD